jgi:3-phenylpropionate/cinnamic acid dioxygenase small subunit
MTATNVNRVEPGSQSVEAGREDRQQVADLLDRYVASLDERRFDDWLRLFTDDCYYTMLLLEDYVKDTNMVAIGEDKALLAGRIEVGQTVELDPTVHLLTALLVRGAGSALQASSNFAVLCMGAIKCSGRYQFELQRRQGALLIHRCTAILHMKVINGIIYLPV